MNDTRLVQRLEIPVKYDIYGFKDNPFSFGGGLRNGGLNPEAMDLLRGIFQFDYMGAAEYEFGQLPQTLQAFAKAELVAGRIALSDRMVAEVFAFGKGAKRQPLPLVYTTVWYICRKNQEEDVIDRIIEDAKGKLNIKNGYQQFVRVLRPDTDKEYRSRTVGFLELDNGFFYFIDQEMWEQTAKLFGASQE